MMSLSGDKDAEIIETFNSTFRYLDDLLNIDMGPEFDPHVRYILSWRFGHEIISTASLPLPLIKEEQLSITGERMCTKYW